VPNRWLRAPNRLIFLCSNTKTPGHHQAGMVPITISSRLMSWQHHGCGHACSGFCTGPELQAYFSRRALQDFTGKDKHVTAPGCLFRNPLFRAFLLSGWLLMPSCDKPDTLLQVALARPNRLGPESNPFQLFWIKQACLRYVQPQKFWVRSLRCALPQLFSNVLSPAFPAC